MLPSRMAAVCFGERFEVWSAKNASAELAKRIADAYNALPDAAAMLSTDNTEVLRDRSTAR